MTDAACAVHLGRLYLHQVTAYRPVPAGEGEGEQLLYEAQPCGLSRSAHISAPVPPDGGAALPEALYRLSLYTFPNVTFRLGDRVEVADRTGRIYHGCTSDSMAYPSHCVTVVEVSEVTEGELDKTHVSFGGEGA